MQYIKYNNVTSSCTTKYSDLHDCSKLVSARYPVRVTDYYAGLVRRQHDAIWKQCMPDVRELEDDSQCPDPLDENVLSPVPGLIHRYPDRVVLLVSNRCPVYCRFCMRKRHVGSGDAPMGEGELRAALGYIAAHSEIHDVILSGGDPLMLDDKSLAKIMTGLRAIPHIAIIRIGTRVPVTLPARITPELCNLLRTFHPLFINTHFNHPAEITASSTVACGLLADAGIPLGNQTVLLRGVNDSVETMRELVTGLLALRVRPYYLHQMDLVQGTAHFRTSVRTGLEIIRGLRGHVSGLAVPHYVIDLPGGKGKVALLPDDVSINGNTLRLRTYTGEEVLYEDITTPLE
ncbi:MAG: KamA family radical SAM protein [Desulfuromonadaceae bacterium]|nr:KamA family radical SAM protein [Desulfuromonadaceae bacterium]MDD2848361.1 KamA family radical SAM protein [Desulfuromonadaceae bacterium]MDD4129243.1 KamA family radical SAM protein [Desulfuromonadaceae bacterium]